MADTKWGVDKNAANRAALEGRFPSTVAPTPKAAHVQRIQQAMAEVPTQVPSVVGQASADAFSSRPPIGPGSTIKPSMPSAFADTLASGTANTELSGRALMASKLPHGVPGGAPKGGIFGGFPTWPPNESWVSGAENASTSLVPSTERGMSQIPTHAAQMAGAEIPTLIAQEPGITSGIRGMLASGAHGAAEIFAKAAASPVGRALGSALSSRLGQFATGPAGAALMEAIPTHYLGDGSLDMSELPDRMQSYSPGEDGPDSEPDGDPDDPTGMGARQLPPMSQMPELPMGDTSQVRATPLPGSPDFRKAQMAKALAQSLSRGR